MDEVKGRRKRGRPNPKESPIRKEIDAMRAANVPQSQIAEVMSKHFRSPKAQKKAIKRLIQMQSGEHARGLTD